MRLLIDTLIALLLAGALGSIVWYQRHQSEEIDQVAAVQESLRAIQAQSMYRAAVGESGASPVGFALKLSSDWFEPLPANPLVDAANLNCRWMDVVPEVHRGRFDPPSIIADNRMPAFWYNPHRGIIRARVPMQVSQQQTVDLYNLVNGTALKIEDVNWDAAAPALSHIIDKRSTRQHGPSAAAAAEPADAVLRDFSRRRP